MTWRDVAEKQKVTTGLSEFGSLWLSWTRNSTAYCNTTKWAYSPYSWPWHKVSLLSTETTVTPQRVPIVHTAYCDNTKWVYCIENLLQHHKVSLLSTEPIMTPQRVSTVHTAYCDTKWAYYPHSLLLQHKVSLLSREPTATPQRVPTVLSPLQHHTVNFPPTRSVFASRVTLRTATTLLIRMNWATLYCGSAGSLVGTSSTCNYQH